MPNWVVLVGLTMAGWLLLTVVGGILVGRALGRLERRYPREWHVSDEPSAAEERKAA